MTSSFDTSKDGFRGPQVCKIVGITYRQLDHWARTDLVTPSVHAATGSGTQRLYSYGDVVELRVIKGLLDSGLSLQKARKAVEYLRETVGTDIGSAHLVITGETVALKTDAELTDLLRNGQGVFGFAILPMSGVIDDLDAKIAEFAPQDQRQTSVSEAGADGFRVAN